MIMIHVTEKCYFEWTDTDSWCCSFCQMQLSWTLFFLIVTRSVNDRTLLGQWVIECQGCQKAAEKAAWIKSFALWLFFELHHDSSLNIHGWGSNGPIMLISCDGSLGRESSWQNRVLVSSCGPVEPGALPQLGWGFVGGTVRRMLPVWSLARSLYHTTALEIVGESPSHTCWCRSVVRCELLPM